MNDKLILESENSLLKHISIYLIGGLGASILGYNLILDSCQGAYPQIMGILLGSFFGLFGFYLLLSIYKINSILIYSDYLIVKSIFGNTKKVIYLNEITSWSEIDKASKNSTYKQLTIYTNKNNFKLSSNNYTNYQELKSAIVKEKKRDKQKDYSLYIWSDLYSNLVQIMIGIGALIVALFFYSYRYEEIENSELHTIKDVITNKAEVEKGSKGSRSISINLKSNPLFIFDVNENAYTVTLANDYVSNVKIGDTLYVDILKEEYQKKITKEKEAGFLDKTINYSFITVYGLRDKNNIYLTLEDYNKENIKDTSIGILIFGLMGVIIIIIGFNSLKKN